MVVIEVTGSLHDGENRSLIWQLLDLFLIDTARTRSYNIRVYEKSICVNTLRQIIQLPPRLCPQTIADIPADIRPGLISPGHQTLQ
ncbi:hypothetical protein CEXT_719021 [Caerostris extrusa]|uniref:LAGLIDADG homing endonuclease n=1 Tax=Caerostris extrusa TaxID=172846 RepID=A0AAV4U440_CAEEX|nr:hypothetical protein CEXT_719021 [Caerostris extrusa]